MIEIIGKEYSAVLVVQIEQINEFSTMKHDFSRPQVIHIYAYDMHLLSGKMNVETLIYYIDRFKIDYLAINIPIMKYVRLGSKLINNLKLTNKHTKVIVTGEAVTTQIAKDIGADGYTLRGYDLVRVIESL